MKYRGSSVWWDYSIGVCTCSDDVIFHVLCSEVCIDNLLHFTMLSCSIYGGGEQMLCLPNVSRSPNKVIRAWRSKRKKWSLQKTIGINLSARHVMHNHRMYNKPKKQPSDANRDNGGQLEAKWTLSAGFSEVLPAGGRGEENGVGGSSEILCHKCLAIGQL